MFVVHEDMTIYATRGDTVYFPVEKRSGTGKYLFQPGDIIRIKICEKKNYSKVFLLKDFDVEEETTSVNIFLDKREMKFGELINKPTDYWYEVELNPDTYPDTFIGHNEDGPAVFKLFPEAKDVVEGEIPDPEENAAVSRMVVHFVHEYLGDHADTIIQEILKEEKMETIVQEILRESHFDSIVQEILKQENLETIVQEILKQESMETIVQEILKDGNMEIIMQEILKPENTTVIVEQVLEQIAGRLPSGEDGKDGVTFTPYVDAEGNLSWTNDGGRDNPATVNIRGKDGKIGEDGKDGKTPEKGVDYFTEEDKQEIVEGVKESLPKASEIDFSNFDNGSFTETINGEVITHSVTFDSQGRPAMIDSTRIVWG